MGATKATTETATSDGENSNKSGTSVYSRNQVGATTVYGDYVLVAEDHCRVPYDTMVGYKNTTIGCLHSDTCRSNIGCSHKKGRDEEKRISPGIYKKVLKHKKLIGVDPDSNITETELQNLIQIENQKQAELLSGIAGMEVSDDAESKSKAKPASTPTRVLAFDRNKGIISSSTPSSALKKKTKKSERKPAAVKTTNTASEDELEQKVLKSPRKKKFSTSVKVETASEEEEEKAKHASSESSDSSSDDHKTSESDEESDSTEISDSSTDQDRKKKKKSKKKKQKRTKKPRSRKIRKSLYVVAHGYGAPYSIGFYKNTWDEIEFITNKCKGSRAKRVSSEDEGLTYLKTFFKAKGKKAPSWVKKGQPFYPKLSKVHKLVQDKIKNKKRSKYESDSSDSSIGAAFLSSSSDDSSDPSDSDSDDSSSHGSSSSVSDPSDTSSSSSSDGSSDSSRRHRKKKRGHKKSKKTKKKSRSKRSKKTRKPKSSKKLKERVNSSKPDPSAGTGTELFNVSINNQTDLVKKLTPKGIGAKSASLLFDQLDDFSAYPRNQGKSGDSEAVRDFAELAAQTLSPGRALWNFSKDNGYQDNNRNILGTFKKDKDSNKLRELATSVSQAYSDLLERFVGKISSALQYIFRIRSSESDKLAVSTLVYRIGKDTLDFYKGLLNHHIDLLAKHPWNEVQKLLLYHGKKMFEFRTSFHTRAQVMCRLYTYLRDASRANWTSISIVQDQLLRYVNVGLGSPGDDTNISGGGTNGGGGSAGTGGAGGSTVTKTCPHCKSIWIHGIEKVSCPWATLTRKKAIQEAKKFTLRMAEGNATTPDVQNESNEEEKDEV